eukprot:gene2461-3043_t
MISKSILLICLIVGISATTVYGQYQCSGQANTYPIYNEAPVFVNSTANGRHYLIGPSDNLVNVIELYGTPYEMGYAHGVLLKSEIADIYNNFFNYITEMVNDLIKKYADFLPQYLIDLIEKKGIGIALDLTADLTRRYTEPYWFEEMRGLADGSGIPYKTIVRLHMFPELIKAACSMVGAYNTATYNGGLLQLRALDFAGDPRNPMRLHPVVTVYHPQQGHKFSTVTWAGFVGTITGYSQHMGICEKYWYGYKGKSSRVGIPFHFLLRDILQFDNSIDDALNRIYNADRTCAIFIGLGSNSTNTFKAVEYSHEIVQVFDDQTPFPGFAPQPAAHPNIQDVIYIDKAVQPSNNPCLASVLQKNLGQINVQTLIDAASYVQTGDLHIAIYDFSANQMYVSVGLQTGPYPPPANFTMVPAYARQFIQVDLNSFFSNNPQ